MRQDLTDITFLLDRTGSMASKHGDVVGGFNQFLKEQRESEGEALLTLVQFDSEDHKEVVHDARPVQDVPEMQWEDFRPRAMTPLFDAFGSAIVRTGERLAKMPEDQRPAHVVFVCVTDGLENASREYTSEKVKAMVKEQTEKWNWHFMFLGVGIDAFGGAASLGVAAANTSPVSAANTSKAFASAGSKVRAFRASGGISGQSLKYSDEERKKLS